jgi:hypothetical protein
LNRNGSVFVLMGVDDIYSATPIDERPSMSRVHYGTRTGSRLSRRRVLVVAGAVGVGAATAGVAGLSLAGESSSKDSAPLVLSLRDAAKGTFDVFSGESKVTLTDKKLAEKLLKAVKR